MLFFLPSSSRTRKLRFTCPLWRWKRWEKSLGLNIIHFNFLGIFELIGMAIFTEEAKDSDDYWAWSFILGWCSFVITIIPAVLSLVFGGKSD